MAISESVGWETVWQAEVASFSPEKRQFMLAALLEAEGWKRDDGIKSLKITYVKDAHIEGEGFPIYIKQEPTDA